MDSIVPPLFCTWMPLGSAFVRVVQVTCATAAMDASVAETQRLDAKQIIRAADFARRVALKRHADVLAADAAAVVRHAGK